MSLIVAEYLCPVHGRFEVTVERPAPDDYPCGGDSEYDPCGIDAPWTISAPKTAVLSVPCYATVRGGDTERRPGQLDTRPLAEGMPMKEWRKLQDKGRQERRHQQLVEKGLKTKRVQVG